MKRGHLLTPTSLGKACMSGRGSSETKSNHIGWFEIKISELKVSHVRGRYLS